MTIRSEIVDEVRRYLVGPYAEEEMLPPENFPLDFYISGILFPKNTELGDEDKELLEIGSDEDEDNPSSDLEYGSGYLKQNSLGLRCSLKENVQEMIIDVEYGKYGQTENNRWIRVPRCTSRIFISLKEREGFQDIKNDSGEIEAKITWKLEEGKIGTSKQYRVFTVFLSNEKEAPKLKDEKGNKVHFMIRRIEENQKCIFQPVIKISSTQERDIFSGEFFDAAPYKEQEDDSLDLLLRNKKVFAQGYSCAAIWDDELDPHAIRTEIIPSYTARQIFVEAEGDDEKPNPVEMKSLATAEAFQDVEKILKPLLTKYEKWIANLDMKIKMLRKERPELVDAALANKITCELALQRMNDGLALLEKNEKIFHAFVLANKAMLYQRVRYQYAIDKSANKKVPPCCPDPLSQKAKWRPFQIAFILMNIEGIAFRDSPKRNIVDLLWFPTGGGKTEAYLGLAAFAILFRRMTGMEDGSGGSGVTVIMRYTLRLLTLQQFERAASLMCALEMIRRDLVKELGTEPFLLGLWVGWSLTPNSTKASEEAIIRKSRGEDPQGGSPDQLLFCPWCGHDLTWRNYFVDSKGQDATNWTIVHCPNLGCEFHSDQRDITHAIPIVTVDSDIYHRCPSLLIGTVDKFARMPWRPDSSAIFGFVNRHCKRHGYITPAEDHESRHNNGRITVDEIERFSGPDLIIQDELHLISGPIGSMVGLYETAVEYLSSRTDHNQRILPKIVVSTATIRGVDNQIRKLFNRAAPQKFPSPGIDNNDTFFWWEGAKDGRQYVGVSYSHRSMKYTLAKLFSTILQRVSELQNSGENIDPYWTLVGYFNSIRELGGAIRLVEDDVKSNIRSIVSLLPNHTSSKTRLIGRPEELTGRINAEDISRIREIVERNHNQTDSLDVLLATNMISVGIDVERLGLMVITGQPKNSTEYIQVTGRIGRREDIPGLVFTLFSPYKPRDLSQYENFLGHHLTIQKSVEPVSLTPFSERTLERAIHSVYISLIRHTIPSLARKEQANDLGRLRSLVDGLQDVILQRYAEVQGTGNKSVEYESLKNNMIDFLDNWERYIEEARQKENPNGVWYNNPFDPYDTDENKNENILMVDFAEKNADPRQKRFPFATPGSMREVEKEASLYYL